MVTRSRYLGCAVTLAIASLTGAASAQSANPYDNAEDPAAASPAPAAEAPAPAGPESVAIGSQEAVVRVHHAPINSAPPHEGLRVQASVDYPHLVRALWLVYQTASGRTNAVPFERLSELSALIPAEDVRAPGLGYTIEMQRTDGRREAVFASRSLLHRVVVVEDRADARESALSSRLGDRRSVVTAGGDFVLFGDTEGGPFPCAADVEGCVAGGIEPVVRDQYWRVEAGYTYRPLRTVAEFGLRGGVVRGTSLVDQADEATYDEDNNEVGLNYAAPRVRFRFADAWHFEVEFLTSITEDGFSVGGGSALLIGDPYGTKLTLGFETIGFDPDTYFGSRVYTRMDVAVSERVTVAPVVEVTDMPHAEAWGVRLLGELGVVFGGGFSGCVRGGYQARMSTSGGLGLGGNLALAF